MSDLMNNSASQRITGPRGRIRREVKAWRQDPDHLTLRRHQLDAAADDVRIRSEPRLPQVMTDHHDGRRAAARVVGGDQPAQGQAGPSDQGQGADR